MNPPSSTTRRARQSRHRARRGEGEQLRVEILDAAEDLLIKKGSMDAVSVRAIANAVGCTPPALYLHFADKDELFWEVCSRRFGEFAQAIVASLQGSDDPIEQLRAMGNAYIDYGLRNPAHYRILFGGKVELARQVDDPTSLPGFQAFQALVDTVQRGIDEGALVDGDATEMAITLWSASHGYVELAAVHAPVLEDLIDLRGARDGVLEHLLMGIRAR